MVKPLRGWEFDEMEGKSSATEKPTSYLLISRETNGPF